MRVFRDDDVEVAHRTRPPTDKAGNEAGHSRLWVKQEPAGRTTRKKQQQRREETKSITRTTTPADTRKKQTSIRSPPHEQEHLGE